MRNPSAARRLIPFALLFVLACSSVPRTPEAQYRAGVEAQKAGDDGEAFEYFQKVIELDPGHREAQLRLASLHMGRNEPDHAVAHLTKLIDHLMSKKGASPSADLYARRGHIYYQAGNYEKAIRDTTRALEMEPNLTGAYNSRGLAHVVRGTFGKGRSDFRKSLQVEKNAKAYLGLATIRMHRGNWKKAVQSLDRAIETDDEFARAYLYRAIAHREREQPGQMKNDLHSYLKLKNPGASEEAIREQVDELYAEYREKEEG